MLKGFRLGLLAIMASLGASIHTTGQTIDAPVAKLGTIVGTVLDTNGDPIPGATATLQGTDANDRQLIVTSENGFFQFRNVRTGVSYRVSVTANDFSGWTSPNITLEPAQYKIVTDIQLRIATERTAVQVKYDPVEVATEQLKLEETQRVFGVIPNFYVAYDRDAAPLTAKMKFSLALKVSVDPVTVAGVAFVASAKQAADSPKYGQGWDAYGKRVGATAADGLSDIMIGGAILPSLLHQDPRYFYQGTGTTKSRLQHAMLSPFVARSDNGNWGPNYSSLGGDLASSALSNLYYPEANRGAGLVFGNFAIGTAERVGASVAQEFLVGKFTRRAH
ncbi:MAG TPA: carboxypeptidase-like regulatory domain-containing protein [Terriglobales bacterium]|jgi:hypothetical protein|nr:carboxypeptidase-like regulatory domain-containing protein [Terriglobales bacterium]